MKISETYPSRFLKYHDLAGREHKVIIENVVSEKLGDDIKPVINYKGWSKSHPLNKGVSTTIADGLGDETNSWIGREIIIFPTTTDYQGKRYEVVRARLLVARDSKLPVSTAMPPPSDDDEDIPF
jgi:hypothetical protein